MAGLTTEGLVIKTLTEIQAELEASFKAAFGASIDVSAQSAFGQIIGILAEREAELWEVTQAVHAAFNPDSASGSALEALCALTGTTREPATKSTVTATATGTPATALTAGRQMSVDGTGVLFETLDAATITAVSAWASATAYVAGDRVTNNSRVYQCTTGGTSAGSGGPTTTASSITDNTVTWMYLGSGTGAVDIECEATETGPLAAASGTLTVIETPVSGWSSVINVDDADLGADVETDAALRIRREEELVGSSKSSVDAIRAAVLDVDDVEACVVFQNTSMDTDGDGLPPKSVEVLVLGGDDEEVRAAVFASVAAGIETHGDDSGTVTDSAGNSHTVKFSRPDEVTIHVRVDVTKDPDTFPADGSDQLKAAVVAYGAGLSIGQDIRATPIIAACFGVEGVLDVTVCYIGEADPPVAATTITTTNRELGSIVTANVDVNLANGTP